MCKRSPFGIMFKQFYDVAQRNTCTEGDYNRYHLPTFTQSLLVFFMPLAPFWTGLMIGDGNTQITRLIT